jgi:hypothetical protein
MAPSFLHLFLGVVFFSFFFLFRDPG